MSNTRLKIGRLLAGLLAACLAWGGVAHGEDGIPTTQPSIVSKGDDRFDLHFAGTPLASALRLLSLRREVNIISSPGVQGVCTADAYDVTFHEALECILRPNGCTFVHDGNFVHVYTLKEFAEQKAATEEATASAGDNSNAAKSNSMSLTARLFQLNYISTEDVEPMIKALLSTDGKIATMPEAAKAGQATGGSGSGGGSGGSDGGSGGGMNGTLEVGRGNLLSRPDSIMVCDYPDRIAQIEKVIRDLDVRPKQVLVEATILRASLGEQNTLGIDFNVLGGVNFENLSAISPGVTDLTVGVVPQNELNGSSFTARTDFNAAVPAGGFTFGFIHNDVAGFIRALEAVTDATVLANPKVLTLNRQEGHVIVGRRDGYITTTITETVATQTVEFLETGTRLFFRPFISDDGFVRLEIHPEDSSGGLNEQNLPFKRTTEVTTNIMVRDGHTVLIGGLFREAESTTRSQVPYFGNIPVAGALLQTNADSTEREEIIILLTVHVVRDDLYQAASAKLAEDVERLRIGMRKGLQAYGRNRLAQAHYTWAVEHAQAGRYDKALWDARLALHLSPTNLQALKLKEELLQKQELEHEDGAVREFINRRLLGKPEEPIIPPSAAVEASPESAANAGGTP